MAPWKGAGESPGKMGGGGGGEKGEDSLAGAEKSLDGAEDWLDGAMASENGVMAPENDVTRTPSKSRKKGGGREMFLGEADDVEE